MSFFKMSVSLPMFKTRMSDLYSVYCRDVNQNVMRFKGTGDERFFQAIHNRTDALVGFGMQSSVTRNLKPPVAEEVLISLNLSIKMVSGADNDYYWKRFNDIPQRTGIYGTFSEPTLEYVMAGNSFLEQCGKTGVQDIDDRIRELGAGIFARTLELTKKEIKSVRIDC